jgi:2-hydroxy-3-keto-5-methylthiopentenyl-1-phosphate phosphatase
MQNGIIKMNFRKYRAFCSSDWSECLSPNGPFDFIAFVYPGLKSELSKIFRNYTANEITLSEATSRIGAILPGPITPDQMDAYLEERFETYQGVDELIEWCEKHDILFMINTTGMQGYFQRAAARGLLPKVPIISANPMIRYPAMETDPAFYDLMEIQDKPRNTEAVMRSLGMDSRRVILMGDSGGDGPHFEWGAKVGAFLIGSMTKWSLNRYCSKRGISIDVRFGPSYTEGEKRNEEMERRVNFMDLTFSIEAVLAR